MEEIPIFWTCFNTLFRCKRKDIMKEFQITKAVFNNLKDFEIKELRKKFRSNKVSPDKDSVSISYLEILANKADVSLVDVQNKLYKKINVVAFRKLNQRFLDKIFDILSMKEILEVNESYDERSKAIFILEKKLLLIDLLRYRGLFKISDELLMQVIASAKNYENYELLVYAFYKKRLRIPGTDSADELSLLDSEINKYHKNSLALATVKKIYTNLILTREKCNHSKTIWEHQFAIKKIENLLNKSNSQTIQYYLVSIKAHYAGLQGNDIEAAHILLELADFIKESFIFSNNKYGTVLLNIALYKRNVGEYYEAQSYLNDSFKYLNRLNETKIIVYYQSAVLNYLVGENDKTKYFIKLMPNLNIEKIDLKLKYRIYFLNILNLFILGNFQEASLHLSSFKVNNKIDKNLDFERRILQLMISIDLSNYDQSDKILDSLRKLFNDKSLNLNFSKHLKTIFVIMTGLKRVGYDFMSISKKDRNTFDLYSKESKMKGDYLIPFVPWFNAKLKNQPYNHSAAMREMRRKYKADQLELV